MSTKREIKFRAWDEKEKVMYLLFKKGFLQQADDLTLVFDDRDSSYIDDYFKFTDQNGFDIMQFIGLEDKNGKEIFEGDLVRYKDEVWHIRYEPYWSSGWILDGGYTKSGEVKFLPMQQTIRWGKDALGWVDVEVMGNVFENPDLLSKNDKPIDKP